VFNNRSTEYQQKLNRKQSPAIKQKDLPHSVEDFTAQASKKSCQEDKKSIFKGNPSLF